MAQALQKDCGDCEGMEQDARWERLRGTKRYRELMKKYVPEKGKE